MPNEHDEIRDPPRRPFPMLLAVGPGVVVTGSVIGSGELINTPVQAARFGIVLLWAIILACVIKYFLQVEIGRHALVHGRKPFAAFNALPGPKWRGTSWIGLAYMAGAILTAASLIGMIRSSGGLLHASWPLGEHQEFSTGVWTVVVFAIAFSILWRGRYQDLERSVAVLVGVFSLSVVVGLLLIQRTEYRITFEELLSGLKLSFGDDSPRLAAIAVVSLIGALGATANELFMYPYWVLEKGYGKFAGSSASPGWLQRTKGWIRVLQLDVTVCTLLATVTTFGYFLTAAAVFHSQNEVPGGDQIVPQLGRMYTESFGSWSRGLFLVGAFCTLVSTLVVATAAFGRMWADLFASLGWLDASDDLKRDRCHRVVQAVYLSVCLLLALTLQHPPEKLVIFAQYVAGMFCTPLLMFAICWMAFRTDPRLRMGRVSAVFLLLSTLVIVVCLVGSLGVQSGLFQSTVETG